jgi:hypothetical protein
MVWMFLPNRHRAIVPESKVLRYLLDQTHEDGAPKAEFFLAAGFTRSRWQEFARAIKGMLWRIRLPMFEITKDMV